MQHIRELTHAIYFASQAHANQRRKGAAQEPYINHLVEVMDLVSAAMDELDTEVLLAALLHDILEDTPVSSEELADKFGERVVSIVQENSDDMTVSKEQRKQHRLAAMPHKTIEARTVKIADVISNLRAVATSPPAGWTTDRRLSYLNDCRTLIDAARGTNAALETVFDETAANAERTIRGDKPFELDGHQLAARHLENAIGQSVHMIYLANTECRSFCDADVDKLADTLQRFFPSVTIQHADGVYEGKRRAIMIARIRTDSTDAVVTAAQRLCLVFDERFVGVEVGGRYIRIYADDTG